jgi:hypothetical protein
MACLASLDGLFTLVGCATAPSTTPEAAATGTAAGGGRLPIAPPTRFELLNANAEFPSLLTAYRGYTTTEGSADSCR